MIVSQSNQQIDNAVFFMAEMIFAPTDLGGKFRIYNPRS